MRYLTEIFTPRYGWREAFENSECRLSINLLRWRLRFNVGVDRNHECCELAWIYIDLGPLQLNLAIGH